MSYNPYRKFCGRWWRYWFNLPEDALEFIRRLYDYAPLLWNDRDFDYAYLLRMMRFKIRRMRKHMEDHTWSAHCEDRVAELAKADVLLRNVVDDDPDDEWSEHWAQWHVHHKNINDQCQAPGATCRLALSATSHRDIRNWKLLWAHFKKYAQGWWD